ncbi:MAG: hypothetical protein M0023_04095 [Desulfobacteraceae bacterium]|nr:hypothetical protein [Desulfobacteraceae bacterium]
MSSELTHCGCAGSNQGPRQLRPSLGPAFRALRKRLAFPVLLLLLTCFSLPASVSALDTFVLSGRIMNIDGQPVSGAELFVYDSPVTRRPADFISARTGQDGRFSLTLPRKKVWAVARVRGSDKFGPLLPGDRHSGEALILEPDDSAELRQDFTVVNIWEAARQKQKTSAEYQRVTGRVLDRQGKPADNAYVFAHPQKTVRGIPGHISAWTDESGIYTLYLPPGRHYLGASTVFPPPQGSSASRELVVEPGKNAVAIDIKLPL